MISINLYEIFMQILNFGILIFLLQRFLYQPIIRYLDKRSETIAADLSKAEADKNKAAALVSEQEIALEEARVDAKEIREKGEETTRKERELVISKAKQDAEQMLASAKKEVALNAERTKQELLTQVGNISIGLTEKLLKRNLNKSDQEAVLTEYLEKIKN